MNEEAVEKIMVSIGELTEQLSLSKSTIYKMVNDGLFPAPIKIGERRVAWRITAVADWLRDRETLS